MARKRIHVRTVVVEVYDEGDGTITIEGRLEDQQPLDSGYFKAKRRTNDPRPPGVLHGMSARVRVDQKTSKILTTDGEFPSKPYQGCAAMLPWLAKLDGLKITTGYSQNAKERLGGPNGCAHMNTLLQLMANTRSASSAYYLSTDWAFEMWQKHGANAAESYDHPALNSCHMWREDGPLMAALDQGKSPLELDL
ncbi:MAG: DUF2889 domain-containing protein [Dehalococcoidia bacterium]